MKRKRICLALTAAGAAALVLALLLLFRNELRTLGTLEKLDDYGMYRMSYYGDYGFDEFLKLGASCDGDIEAFVTRRLLKGLPLDLGVTGDGCTAFVVRNESGELLFGRNFDFEYAPSLQLRTAPENGYASVSTVNLAFAGYSAQRLPDGSFPDGFLTLAAPFLPFDGMNEKGLAIALVAVPEAQAPFDAEKVTLNTTTAIRLVLDRAATVDEAVELLGQYNIYFSGGIDCHYLIADALGRSVIVEYYDGELKTVETAEDWQIASNFIAWNNLNIGEGYTEFERYDAVLSAIEGAGGVLDGDAAIRLLADVGVSGRLQWSVLYNLSTGDIQIFPNGSTDSVKAFHLDVK